MRRRRKRRKKSEQTQATSMIGAIIDLPLSEFEEELIKQKVNIGTINNLVLNLESMYFELRTRKDAIIKKSFEHTLDSGEARVVVNGLYAEMIKIEQKITYLKQRRKELVNVDGHQIDNKQTP